MLRTWGSLAVAGEMTVERKEGGSEGGSGGKLRLRGTPCGITLRGLALSSALICFTDLFFLESFWLSLNFTTLSYILFSLSYTSSKDFVPILTNF